MAKKLMAPKMQGNPRKMDKVVKPIDRVIPKSKPKSGLLKKALAQGDQSSASSSFTARAARKIATGAGKALKSMAAKPTAKIDSLLSSKKKVAPSVKIDSIKKVNPIGGSKPSVIIKKQTTVKPAKPIAKTLPYTPEKKAIIKKIMK